LKVSTLGANGFAYRKAYLDKIGGQSLGLHSEACLKLIEAGYKFAVVKHCHVIHLMTTSLWSFVKRRILWARVYSHDKLPRTYRVYDPRRDWLKLLGICVSFLTLVVPTLRALKGYARYRDPAWFLHPLVGLVFTVGYGLMVLQGAFSRKATAGNV
jgi:hypothetical protein